MCLVVLQRYMDISIKQMSEDFELIRKALGIDAWLVFGGSWGSTLGLDYTQRFPQHVMGLIIRGIYLNTKPEYVMGHEIIPKCPPSPSCPPCCHRTLPTTQLVSRCMVQLVVDASRQPKELHMRYPLPYHALQV